MAKSTTMLRCFEVRQGMIMLDLIAMRLFRLWLNTRRRLMEFL